jgi:hypothetical protein
VADDVGRYLRDEHAAVADVALWACAAVRAADPDVAPRVYRGWRGIGFRHPEAGYVCGVFPKDDGVELVFEHGASLPDPRRVLRGSGQTRVLHVVSPGDALRDAIGEYVQQAIAQRLLDRGG